MQVKPVDAYIYHYGWVKPPVLQQAKQQHFHKMWHNDDWMEKNIPKTDQFDYSQIDSLANFTGTHPAVMKDRINKKNWTFDFDPAKKRFSIKACLICWIEKNTGFKIGEYKNYRIVK